MSKFFITILFSLLFIPNLKGKTDSTFIFGKNKNYANTYIQIYTVDDFISQKKILLASTKVDSLGCFKLKIPLATTCLLEIPLGIYRGLLYAEPHQNYEIILPEKQNKTFVDSLNPYFQFTDYYLGIKNKNTKDLNRSILEFNNIYSQYIEQFYYDVYLKPQRDTIEAAIEIMENIFKNDTNLYFKNYRFYKFATLRYASYKRNNMYVSNDFFNEMPILYENTAYTELFNHLFSNFLKFYAQKREGKRLYSDIALAKSPTLAKETFSNSLVLTKDSLQELVLLKGINDAFGDDFFPKKSMLYVLDSIIYHSKIAKHKQIAKNIKNKQSQILTGNKAPEFELRDKNGVLRSSRDYLANYIYLNFCSVESFACQQDFELLQKLYEKHKNEFKIISISIDNDFEKARNYFEEKGYPWILLSFHLDKNILKKYKVKSYPTYFLIDTKGNLVMSPAYSPSENFEWYFFKHLQKIKYQELRNKR